MLEDKSFSVPCPECKAKNTVTVADVRAERSITCSGCGKSIKLQDAGLTAGIDNAIDSIRASIRRLSKR